MRYTFNDFTVDTNQYELNHAGEAVHLEPQVLELLVLLIEQRDGVVSKETINDQVWNGRVVSDSALSSRIKALRQALGDDGRSQHTIRTIHKKGFRFVADVKESRLKLTKGNVRPIRDEAPEKPAIAVLPFLNISGDDDQEYFSDGITEDIITALSRFQSLNVIARSSTFAYKDKSTKPQEIGQGLNVQYIIEGSVRKGEEHILVTVQLIESETGNQVWAEKYNRLLVDIFELQDELAKAIVGTLVGRIETTNVQRIKRSPPGDLGVYDRLLHAKVLHHRGSREANEQARKLLDEAIEINPEFSSAFFWKSCCISQGVMRGYIEEYENVWDDCLKLTRKGFSIDENDFEVLWGLCEWHMSFGEWDRAKMVHEKAFMLNPNDPRIVAQRGELLTWLGQPNEAVEWVEKVMHLDPYNADNWSHLLGQALFGAQRYKEAVQAFLRVPTPTYGHHAFLAACYAHLGLDNNANIQAVIVLKMKADFSSNEYVTSALFPPLYQKEEDVSHLLDGLHKAGLPE